MRIKNAVVILYLFLAIFDPPLFRFNIIFLLLLLALFYLLTINRKMIRFRVSKDISTWLGVVIIYLLIVALFGELFGNNAFDRNRLVFIYQVFFLMPAQFICAYAVVEYSRKQNLLFEDVINMCVVAGLLQGILSLAAWLIPDLQRYFLGIMIERGGKSVYESIETYRGYGFADSLLDTFGYGMGLLAGACLLKKRISPYYLISALFIVFSIAINSRTGIAIIIVAIGLKFFWVLKNADYTKNRYIKILLIVIFTSIGVSLFVNSGAASNKTISWITAGFESIWSFFTGKRMQYRLGSLQGSMFTKRFWTLPDNILSLLFGTGHTIYATASIMGGLQSDVGYINYIWFCGLIGTMAVLLLIFKFFKKSYKMCVKQYDRIVVLFVAISFYVMFIKGNVLTHTAGTFVSILWCLSCNTNQISGDSNYVS